MKNANGLLQKKITLIITLIFCIISIPTPSKAQNQDDLEKITLFVSCVEDLGDGRLIAYFGYNNPTDYTIYLQKKRSYIAYNYTRDIKYFDDHTFLPGYHDRFISQEFVSDDWVRWTVKFSNRVTKIVRADIDSERCEDEELIVPYYTPPSGGKLSISLIGAELNSLYEKSVSEGNNFHPVSDDIFQINESLEVFIEVVAQNASGINDLVDELNGYITNPSSEDFLHLRATYWFPIRQLIDLNDFTNLNFARPVFTGINDKIDGQGDVAMRSDYTRMGFYGIGTDPEDPFYLDGSGVRVGVISNSYNTKATAALDVLQGDLPGQNNELGYTKKVEVLKDIITPLGFALSDEGRAMMQIVHDVSPGAELVFRTGYLGELDMAQGIRDLANPEDPVFGNCDIIVDDITYITEPFFRDGIISQAIDDVVGSIANPVCYFSSAGNFGKYSYEDVYSPGSPITGVDGVPHNFGDEFTEDVLQLISLDAGTYTLVLQWDDGTHADQAVTSTDLDIFLTHDDGTTLFGFNRVNTGGAPVEVLPFTVLEDGVFTNILITQASDQEINLVPFKYVVFRGGSGFRFEEEGHEVGSSTIVGHANADGTIAVGAVRYHHTPAYGEDILMEDFSSMGGTPIMNHSAENPVSAPIVRDKPDFTAPDGVNTSIDLSSDGSSDYDGDLLPNFFGTSAAAPHAAGAAALIIQARRSFANDNSPAPDAIRELMRITSIGNVLDPVTGYGVHDPVKGYGFIQPYAAIRTFANPKPEIDEIIYSGVNPGESLDPITFTLKGNFYIDEENPDEHTEIHFRGEELISGVEIEDENTIIVTHSFLGNPAIQAVNPPTPSGGPVLDGGTSDPIFFSTTLKTDVVITARSFEKKFGESLPDFSSIILEDDSDPTLVYNLSINYDDFAVGEKERILSRLSFDVKATASSAVANYDINLEFAELDPDEELDHAIAEKYNITIEQGYLVIKKLALTITPEPATIVYGHELTQDKIKFDFDVNSDYIDQSVLDDLEIKYNNPLPIGVPMVNGIALVRGTALVNNPDGDIIRIEVDVDEEITLFIKIEGTDEFVLVDMAGPLPRGIALVNGQPFVQIEEIIDGEGMFNGEEVTFKRIEGVSYITALEDGSLGEPLAVKNGIALVRGTALVNNVKIEIMTDGTVLINGHPVVRGTALVNGIPFIRGTALVNSRQIVRGTALVNEVEVPINSGIPDVGADVNGINPRGIALVNGIPLVRGTALVNNLNIELDQDGGINVVGEELAFVNGIALVRGTALVNGIPLVRGTALVNGKSLVRGVALVNDVPAELDLANINFLASTNSLNHLSFVNETKLRHNMTGVAGFQLEEAADPLTNEFTSEDGIALVNGRALVRGTALVNGHPVVRGTALVNDKTISAVSNEGAIVINHEAEESSSYIPVTFITGTDVGTHSIIPGTFLSNNFDISYGFGELTIKQAELTVTAADNQSKTYGQEDPILNIKSYTLDGKPNAQDFDGTVGDVDLYGNDALSGSLSRNEGEDVATYTIGQGSLTAGANYNLTFVPGTFTINQAPLSIKAVDLGKTYGGTEPALTYIITAGSLVFDDALSGSLLRDIGEDVATYTIEQGGLTAGTNYALSFVTGTFTIIQAPLSIKADDLGKTYGGTEPTLTYEITAGSLVFDDALSGSLIRDIGEDVATYTIGQGGLTAGANYNLTFEPGIFTIGKASLTLWPGINGKNFGDPEPPTVIDRYELDGVANSPDFNGTIGDVDLYDDDELTGSLSRETGEEVGSYDIELGYLSAGPNYDIFLNMLDQPRFYINPYGPGTRAIKPALNCVEQIGPGLYIANLEYKNDNAYDVYIPMGENNQLSGTGISLILSDEGNHQPTLFKAEGGSFIVQFDGTELSWVVNSLDEDHKVSSAANANSSSTKCKKNDKKSASSAAGIVEDEVDPDLLVAYPNPVTDKVHITMKDIEHYKTITLYDMTGKQHFITSIDKRTDNLEIDMAQLPAGYYIFKIVMEDSSRVVQVIKE